IASEEIKDDLIETAKKNNIKYQLEIFPSGSTDGATINLERGGIPTGVLDIPARYVHANEMVSLKDVIEVIYLIIMYLQNFN
ncbi:MAG: M42 family peptidase, partial [Halanaerobiales bacterium]